MASLVNDEAADLTLVALLAESPGKNQVRKYVSCELVMISHEVAQSSGGSLTFEDVYFV